MSRSTSAASLTSCQSNCGEQTEAIERSYLENLGKTDLSNLYIAITVQEIDS